MSVPPGPQAVAGFLEELRGAASLSYWMRLVGWVSGSGFPVGCRDRRLLPPVLQLRLGQAQGGLDEAQFGVHLAHVLGPQTQVVLLRFGEVL